jgi:hypothetical protein
MAYLRKVNNMKKLFLAALFLGLVGCAGARTYDACHEQGSDSLACQDQLHPVHGRK